MSGISNDGGLPTCSITMRTGRILDSRRTRQQVVLQKIRSVGGCNFNPFRDSAACTIAMRWQHRLKSSSSEDQTLLLETRTRRGSRFLPASFAGRRISLPSKTEVLTSSGMKPLLTPAQRFCERQARFLHSFRAGGLRGHLRCTPFPTRGLLFSQRSGLNDSGLPVVTKQGYEQVMLLDRKRICDCDTLPGESFLQVFGKKQTTSAFSGGGEDHSVPNTELMVGREIRR